MIMADEKDPFDELNIDEKWIEQARFREQAARERDLEAKRRRWSEEDRRELAGKDVQDQVKAVKRKQRWRKTWPWLVFAGLCVILIGGSRLLGY